ncbi:MAG: hypothetical protein ABII90_09505 [Bacteroidota bacterium]
MNKLLLITAVILFGLPIFAQKIKVSQSSENIGSGRNNALTVIIYEADDSEVRKEWKSLMKSYNAKVTSGKEVFADDVNIPSISGNTIDIYAKAEEESNNTVKLIVGFDLGGAYLSSQQSGYNSAETMLYNFAVRMTKEGVEKQLAGANKEQVKLEKNLEKLKKTNDRLYMDIERYKKQIEEATKNIEQAEKDVVTNGKDQEQAGKDIEEQKKEVQKVADKLKDVK